MKPRSEAREDWTVKGGSSPANPKSQHCYLRHHIQGPTALMATFQHHFTIRNDGIWPRVPRRQ
jgi:hypothetical protein